MIICIHKKRHITNHVEKKMTKPVESYKYLFGWQFKKINYNCNITKANVKYYQHENLTSITL